MVNLANEARRASSVTVDSEMQAQIQREVAREASAMPEPVKDARDGGNAKDRSAADPARPNSTLSASEDSDSGCSFGGISPVNFGWPIGITPVTATVLPVKALNSSPYEEHLTVPAVIRKQEKVENIFESVGKLELDAMSASQSFQLLQYDKNEKNVANDKPATVSINSYTVASSSSLSNYDSRATLAEQFQNGGCPFGATAMNSSLQSLHPASATFSDITKYINPTVYNMRSALLSQTSNGRGAVNGSDSLSGPLDALDEPTKPTQQEMYKTVMCQAWLESTKCLFGENCKFAHGEAELRPARISNRNNAKYKTKLCEKYTTNGICPYGDRCLFIHPTPPMSAAAVVAATAAAATSATVAPVKPEIRQFANPSFVNPEIQQRKRSLQQQLQSSFVPVEELNECHKLHQQHLANSTISSCLSGVKRSSIPFLKSMSSSMFSKVYGSSNGGFLTTTSSRKHSCSSAVEPTSFYRTGGTTESSHNIWSNRNTAAEFFYENDEELHQLWGAKLRGWPQPDECHSYCGDQCCRKATLHQQQQQSHHPHYCNPLFLQAQRRERCHTQNESSFQELHVGSLTSSSMLALSEKLARPSAAAMLRRLNNTALMGGGATSVGCCPRGDGGGSLASNPHADQEDAIWSRADSAIWTTSGSSPVGSAIGSMVGSELGSRLSQPSYSSHADFFDADYGDFLLGEKSFFDEPHDAKSAAPIEPSGYSTSFGRFSTRCKNECTHNVNKTTVTGGSVFMSLTPKSSCASCSSLASSTERGGAAAGGGAGAYDNARMFGADFVAKLENYDSSNNIMAKSEYFGGYAKAESDYSSELHELMREFDSFHRSDDYCGIERKLSSPAATTFLDRNLGPFHHHVTS